MQGLKPGVAARTHFFLAAFLWAAVGLWLFSRGVGWLVTAGKVFWLLPAVLAGTIKSLLVLDRVARGNIKRIAGFSGKHCLGGVYSVRSWLLVLGMIIMGHYLRHAGLSLVLLGFFYSAIGWALFFSSRLIWLHWRRDR